MSLSPERPRFIRALSTPSSCHEPAARPRVAKKDQLSNFEGPLYYDEVNVVDGTSLLGHTPGQVLIAVAQGGPNMAGTVTLVVTGGPRSVRGRTFVFDEHDTFVVGRGADCHARLPDDDDAVSRHHFILEVVPPDARVRDLGSRNATFVNGVRYGGRAESETPEEAARRPYPAADLKDGDEIRVGETVITVRVDQPNNGKATRWLEGKRCARCDIAAAQDLASGSGGLCRDCERAIDMDPRTALAKNHQAPEPKEGCVTRTLTDASAEANTSRDADIDDYELGQMLGRGGMGAVYRARRKRDGASVAVKVMLPKVAVDEDARRRFWREIVVHSRLQHENIVPFLAKGWSGSGFFFVMTLCGGGSVEELMKRRGGRLSPAEACPLMLQALDGLAHAHARNVVHRDIKPPNLMLSRAEGGGAMVSDFGLARSFDKAGLSGMTATGTTAGTPRFMPREQLTSFKRVMPSGDVWSLGATFYYLLTAQFARNFKAGSDPVAVILREAAIPIQERDHTIPRTLAQVIDRSLDDVVSNRYQTAGEFRDALVKAL